MIKEIITISDYPDLLAAKALDLSVADILSSSIQTLIEDMKDTCHAAEGLGLAATQIGAGANLCVYKEPGAVGYKVLINPYIKGHKEPFKSKAEGCLSVPGRRFNVTRYKKITVEGLDEHGNKVEFTTKSKKLAVILQHEIDHLNGITIADKGKEI